MLLASLLLFFPAQAETSPDLEADLRRIATPIIEGEVVPGLAVSWRMPDGERGFFGLGRISQEDGSVPGADSVFEIGSITKTFTALLLARRVADDELALSTELSDILPKDFRPPVSVTPVRLVDIATHSAGFPAIPTNLERDMSLFVVDYSVYSQEKLRRYLKSFEPLTTPGQSFLYSNTGFGVLGWALSNLAGESYEELLQREIFEPLQLSSTFIQIAPKHEAALVTSHDSNGDPVAPADFATLEACGAIRSSSSDMMRYLEAQLSPAGELKDALELTQKLAFRDANGTTLGLAWILAGDGKTYFHDGQTGGQACFAFFNPTDRVAGVVLANGSTARIADLGIRIMQRIFGQPIEPPSIRLPIAIKAEQLMPLVGSYSSLYGSVMRVTQDKDRLYARLPRQAAFRLFPISTTRFFYRDIDAEISFEFEEEQPSAVVLHQNGREIRYQRRD